MDIKTKKILLISFIFVIIIGVVSLFYNVRSYKDFEFKTGTYFCQMNIINENNGKVFKWDIGIAKNNAKSGIIENEVNRKSLTKFRDTVSEIIQKRFEVFLAIVYLIFILTVFVTVQKDSQILKKVGNKRAFQLFIILLIIFLIYKISIYIVELNVLYKDINFYFSLVS